MIHYVRQSCFSWIAVIMGSHPARYRLSVLMKICARRSTIVDGRSVGIDRICADSFTTAMYICSWIARFEMFLERNVLDISHPASSTLKHTLDHFNRGPCKEGS
jgi:hypothetical protein